MNFKEVIYVIPMKFKFKMYLSKSNLTNLSLTQLKSKNILRNNLLNLLKDNTHLNQYIFLILIIRKIITILKLKVAKIFVF